MFVNIGSSCPYGAAGNGISLFIKNKTGAWQRELGFGGPGFCEEVLRWNGKTCKHYKNVATAPGGGSGH